MILTASCCLNNVARFATAITAWVLFSIAPGVTAEPSVKDTWTGSLADGSTLSRDRLDALLVEHERWLATDGAEGTRADLTGANLERVELRGRNLRQAILIGAKLGGADLSSASLDEADLSGADFGWVPHAKLAKASLQNANCSATDFSTAEITEADLRGALLRAATFFGANGNEAQFQAADLTGAKIRESEFRGAHFEGANLTNADVVGTDLSGALFKDTNLTNVRFHRSTFRNVLFEPQPGAIPNIPYFASVQELERLGYRESPHALFELREAFRAAFRNSQADPTHSAAKNPVRIKISHGQIGPVEPNPAVSAITATNA